VNLFTARYADYDPACGIAVRTSVGMPRGWRHGPLEHVRRLTPYGLRHITDRAEFTRLYTARLECAGAEPIFTRLQGISDAHDGQALVLCCFEDVRKPGVWCHRNLLGEWLEDRLAIEIVELGRSPAAGGMQTTTGGRSDAG
jgi:hypothetical protein